uniref:Uncharacterized protein n=1 Tax=Phlebotomus papatasi TaxID=29031 RepID=A0A1B0D032_PHLPP
MVHLCLSTHSLYSSPECKFYYMNLIFVLCARLILLCFFCVVHFRFTPSRSSIHPLLRQRNDGVSFTVWLKGLKYFQLYYSFYKFHRFLIVCNSPL